MHVDHTSDASGLDPVPVTSGSKGIHLYSALDGERTSEEVSAVAHELARALEADLPELPLQAMLGILIMISGLVIYAVFRNREHQGRVAAAPGRE